MANGLKDAIASNRLERETAKDHDDFLVSLRGWTRIRLHAGTLKRRGCFVFMNTKGTPDKLYLRRRDGIDQILFLENKRDRGGKLSPDQIETIGKLRNQGFRVAMSDTLDAEFIAWHDKQFGI